jgi:hypothetical protein
LSSRLGVGRGANLTSVKKNSLRSLIMDARFIILVKEQRNGWKMLKRIYGRLRIKDGDRRQWAEKNGSR